VRRRHVVRRRRRPFFGADESLQETQVAEVTPAPAEEQEDLRLIAIQAIEVTLAEQAGKGADIRPYIEIVLSPGQEPGR